MTLAALSRTCAVAVITLVAAPASADVPVARAVTCPAGMICTPEAVDGGGRFIAYTVSTRPITDSTTVQIFVHDTFTGADRFVGTGLPRQLEGISVRLTDDGRYVLYDAAPYRSQTMRVFDATTGTTTDFPRVVDSGVSYTPIDWSRDVRSVLYWGPLQQSSRLAVYDRQSGSVSDIPVNGFASPGRLSPDARYVTYRTSGFTGGTTLYDRVSGRSTLLPDPVPDTGFGLSATFTSSSQYVTVAGAAFETATGRLVARAPGGEASPAGRYVVYPCVEDPRDAAFCIFDRVTTTMSRAPAIPGVSGNVTTKWAVVDDLGRVAYHADVGDVYTTCGSYFVPPSQILGSNAGATLDVPLIVSSGVPCEWTAQSNVPWITITSAAAGAGSATVSLVVASNGSGPVRTGTVTIAGQTLAVTQGQNSNAAPGAPVFLRTPDSIGWLTWGVPIDGGPVTNYIVEGGTAPGLSNRFRFSTGTATAAPVALTSDSCCSQLYLRVKAANAFGESLASNEVAMKFYGRFTTGCFSTPPDAPEGFDVVVDGSTVTLRWRAPAGLEAQSSFILEAGSVSGLLNLANFVTGNTATVLVAPGVPPGTYVARVRAINTCGTGPASNETVVTVR